jgi:CheY-like chemotaxis protein
VCDRNPAAARRTGRVLESAGYTVVFAVSGKEALEKAASEQPRVMVVDAEVPEMDGYQVAARLSELGAHQQAYDIPVILVSDDLGSDLGPWHRGVSAYLTRPPDPRNLLEFVRRILTNTGE